MIGIIKGLSDLLGWIVWINSFLFIRNSNSLQAAKNKKIKMKMKINQVRNKVILIMGKIKMPIGQKSFIQIEWYFQMTTVKRIDEKAQQIQIAMVWIGKMRKKKNLRIDRIRDLEKKRWIIIKTGMISI